MQQDALVKALTEHLNALESIFGWMLLVAIALLWAGISMKTEIEVFGTKFQRSHAFYVAAALYLIVNATVLILFLRIGDLFKLIDDAHFVEAFSATATHRWILNPFSYFGGAIARIHAGGELGLLIVVWWLGNASLAVLRDGKNAKTSVILLSLFLLVGLLSLGAILLDYDVILSRIFLIDRALHDELWITGVERGIGCALGVIIGVLLYIGAHKLQKELGQTG